MIIGCVACITRAAVLGQLVRHGMLLDCDGLPGAEGSGLAGSAGSAALSLGRVCVNQPFLVYCRVVGNPKRPVTLTAVHLQLVRPPLWV